MEFKIKRYYVVSSTNMLAKEKIKEGCNEGLVIVSSEQTQGRGRLGRTWYSPEGKGMYMSIILKPQLSSKWLAPITLLTAVAVNKAIEQKFDVKTQIKWPNDLLVNGKKICGILLESVVREKQLYIIVGIGVNINQSFVDFEDDIKDIATSISMQRGNEVSNKDISDFYEVFLNCFKKEYIAYADMISKTGKIENLIEAWTERSCTIGKNISFTCDKSQRVGKAVGLDSEGQLVVELNDGKMVSINSGEINILD